MTAATPKPETTTAPDGSFAFTGAPGHYLLVIGSDLTTDTSRATIHDNVTLVAGANALQAPVLPPWPTVTPPPWETNGTYRIAAIDATTMLPCFNSYNSHRTSNGLAATVFDEWLLENVRGKPGILILHRCEVSACGAVSQEFLAAFVTQFVHR